MYFIAKQKSTNPFSMSLKDDHNASEKLTFKSLQTEPSTSLGKTR
jgi:hypothetical protein